jgi:hypothetical protein
MKSVPAIAFDYRPSVQVGATALSVAAVAVVAPWLTGLPVALRALASLFALLVAGRSLRHHAHPGFRRIAWRASGWTLVRADGHEQAAELRRHARFGTWLLLLDFRHGPRAHFRAVIAPDNLDADTHRRLILLLRRADVLAADGDRAA